MTLKHLTMKGGKSGGSFNQRVFFVSLGGGAMAVFWGKCSTRREEGREGEHSLKLVGTCLIVQQKT